MAYRWQDRAAPGRQRCSDERIALMMYHASQCLNAGAMKHTCAVLDGNFLQASSVSVGLWPVAQVGCTRARIKHRAPGDP